MFGDLFVVLKAKIAGFVNKIKEMIGITKGATDQINGEAKKMQDAFNSAFGGDLRNNIANLTENITEQKNEIIALESQVRELTRQQARYAQGSAEYDKIANKIKILNQRIREQRVDLAASNAELSRQKKALSDSRLAAEDNSAAIEATSRAVNAASSAILLLGNNNEDLKPILKGVSTALALINAAVVIQNLRLRENAVLTNLVTRAKNLYTTATTGATAATTAFRTALTITGIGAAIVALGYLASKFGEVSNEVEEAEKRLKRFQNRLSKYDDFIEDEIDAIEKQVEIDQKRAKLSGKTDADLLKIRQDGYDRQIEALQKYQKQIQIEGAKLEKQEIKNGANIAAAQEIRRKFELEETKKSTKAIFELENKKTNAVLDFQIKQNEELKKLDKKTEQASINRLKTLKSTLEDELSIRINAINQIRQLSLASAKSELEKAEINKQADNALFNTRESFAEKLFKLNLLDLQSASEYNEKLSDINKDRAESDRKYQDAILKAKEKDIQTQREIDANMQQAIEDGKKAAMKFEEKKAEELKQQALELFEDKKLTEKQYNIALLRIELASLEERKKQLIKFGDDITEINKKIRNAQKDIYNAQKIDFDRFKEQLERSYQDLFSGIAEAFGASITALATGGDPIATLFNNLLSTVATFMSSFGKAMISVGLALLKLDLGLKTLNPFVALAGGVALIAAAGVARAMAQKGVAKFADGGIVSGPTLGLVGEYPGASTNPEVIAPLDKLKSLIGGNGDGDGFIAETRISGRDLAIVLNRYNKDNARG